MIVLTQSSPDDRQMLNGHHCWLTLNTKNTLRGSIRVQSRLWEAHAVALGNVFFQQNVVLKHARCVWGF